MEKIEINIEDTNTSTISPEYVAPLAPLVISEEYLANIDTMEPVMEEVIQESFDLTPIDESVHEVVKQEVETNEDITGTEIASIKSSNYGGFVKILETVSTGSQTEDVISIKEGQLISSKNGGIISCDLSSVFGKNSWNLKNPLHNIKLLKLIRGGHKVTIMDDTAQYIVYSSDDAGVKSITFITKANEKAYESATLVDIGVLKYSMEIPLEIIDILVAAKTAHGGIYYNITLEEDTYKLLSIDINDKHKEIISSENGRVLTRFKVKELFPVSKPEKLTFEVFENNGQIFIKTSSKTSMAPIFFQIAALKNPKRNDLDLNHMV